jgi:hypothetical protein
VTVPRRLRRCTSSRRSIRIDARVRRIDIRTLHKLNSEDRPIDEPSRFDEPSVMRSAS